MWFERVLHTFEYTSEWLIFHYHKWMILHIHMHLLNSCFLDAHPFKLCIPKWQLIVPRATRVPDLSKDNPAEIASPSPCRLYPIHASPSGYSTARKINANISRPFILEISCPRVPGWVWWSRHGPTPYGRSQWHSVDLTWGFCPFKPTLCLPQGSGRVFWVEWLRVQAKRTIDLRSRPRVRSVRDDVFPRRSCPWLLRYHNHHSPSS